MCADFSRLYSPDNNKYLYNMHIVLGIVSHLEIHKVHRKMCKGLWNAVTSCKWLEHLWIWISAWGPGFSSPDTEEWQYLVNEQALKV